MADMPPFCNQADLEIAVGGAHVLVQLADPNNSGNVDAATVTDYLETGRAEILSAAEIKHDPEMLLSLDSDSLRRLKDVNAALSARTAYTKGGKGMAMPEFVSAAADRADKYLDQLAHGERRLGRVAGGKIAAINQPVEVFDHDKIATSGIDPPKSVSGISIAAFKLGFR